MQVILIAGTCICFHVASGKPHGTKEKVRVKMTNNLPVLHEI